MATATSLPSLPGARALDVLLELAETSSNDGVRLRAAELVVQMEPQVCRLEPHIERLLMRLLTTEERMSANQTSEAQALEDALAALNTELGDVEGVDDSIAEDVQALPAIFASFNPTTVEQVNAVTAATARVTSIVERLKGIDAEAKTDEAAAEPEAPAGGTPATPQKTVYGFNPEAEGAVVDERFTPSGFQTPAVPAGTAPEVPAGETFYFSGDSAPGEQHGASVPGYFVISSAVEAVPAG